MNRFLLFIFLLSACGPLPLNTTYQISSTATDQEYQNIEEVFKEFTEYTTISLVTVRSKYRVKVWELDSPIGISVEECTDENLCLRYKHPDGTPKLIAGYEIPPRSIYLRSFETGWNMCLQPLEENSEVLAWDHFRWTVLHELGHAFGLQHDESGENPIMSPSQDCLDRFTLDKRQKFYDAIIETNGLKKQAI